MNILWIFILFSFSGLNIIKNYMELKNKYNIEQKKFNEKKDMIINENRELTKTYKMFNSYKKFNHKYLFVKNKIMNERKLYLKKFYDPLKNKKGIRRAILTKEIESVRKFKKLFRRLHSISNKIRLKKNIYNMKLEHILTHINKIFKPLK